jgi:phenylpyruvate tautomerase PptA (4-oxalocrotonate tautomerase family)
MLEQSLFLSIAHRIGGYRNAVLHQITQEGTVSAETKAKIAEEITRIHTIVMKVPKNFVRVVFLSYPKGSGFTGGEQAPTASLNCVLRSGHTLEEKTDMLQQLWAMFQDLTGMQRTSSRFLIRRSHLPMPWRWGKSCKRSDRNSA